MNLSTASSIKDIEQLTIRLKRNLQCVQQSKKLLNSYRYEPKNYEGFMAFKELKQGFAALVDAHLSVLDDLKYTPQSYEVAEEKVSEILSQYGLLEKKMGNYLLVCSQMN